MSDTDNAFDPSDFVLNEQRATVSNVLSATEDQPDRVARAYQLGKETDSDPALIYPNLDNFESQHKATLTSQLLNNSKYLRQYVEDPMRAKLSHDDLGPMDAVSDAVQKLNLMVPDSRKIAGSMLGGVIAGAKKGFGDGRIGTSVLQSDEDFEYAKEHPVQAALAASAATPLELILRSLSGGLEGVKEGLVAGAKTAYTQFGGSESEAERFGRGMGELTEFATTDVPAMHKIEPHLRKAEEVIRSTAPWIDAGVEPPAGLHPEIDKIKAKQNDVDLKNLDAATKEAQGSATRERDPDIFADFIRSHTDATIGISAEGLQRIYGEKVPEAGDNLLGFHEKIADDYRTAVETGGDVQIPLADWLAKVDPEVAKELHDDIRVRPGAITKAEVEAGKDVEPKELIPEPLPQMRAAAGLEPMFSVGDRKLTLKRFGGDEPFIPEQERAYAAGEMHDFEIHNERGEPVGYINMSLQKDGKQIYIENIEGVKGNWTNDLGPAAVRDLMRQLKAEFPEATELSGHRISGMRREAGTVMSKGTPVVKLDSADIFNDFKKASDEGGWVDYGGGVEAHMLPKELYTQNDLALKSAVEAELKRIAPKDLQVEAADQINVKGSDRQTRGAYIQNTDQNPIILWSLNSPDAIGTVRHEAIHHLRNYGFFKENEWNTLGEAAKSLGWMEKYKINERYGRLDENSKLEEAVADAYKDWANRTKAEAVFGKMVNGPIEKIFARIKELINAIGTKFKEILGHEPSWDELFKSVDEGKIGSREGNKPLNKSAFKEARGDEGGNVAGDLEMALRDAGMTKSNASWFANEGQDYKTGLWTRVPLVELEGLDKAKIARIKREFKTEIRGSTLWVRTREFGDDLKLGIEPKLEVGSEAEAKERDLFAKASAVGMTQDQYKRYMKLIDRRNQEDVVKAEARAEKEQTKRQSAEWKSAEIEMRPKAVEDVNARPAIAADTYFREGVLHGEKINGPKIAADTLTPDQAALLPKGYVAKTGLDADQFASAFGFKDGQAMVMALTRLEEDRAQSGMRPDEYKRRLINAEVERRMQAEHGDLSENILEAAKEQALSETQLDILHEETIALASQAKVAAPIPQDALKSAVRENFKNLSMAGLTSDKFMSFAGKAGRTAEMGLLKGDYAEAFRAKQQQYNAILYANEAKALEQEAVSFDKMTKRLSAREQKSIDPSYTNFIHDIMVKIGRPVKRSVQDIQSAIEAGEHPTLESFVDFQQQHGLREVPVAAFLYDKEFRKDISEMTVDEFRAVKDSITTLAKNGRDELKIVKAGEEADLNVVKDQMIDQLKTFKEKHYDAQGGRWLGPLPPAVAKPLRTYLVSHLQLESIFNRWDRGDPRGVFSQYISRELSSAANYESALEKKYSSILKDTSDNANLKESIPNPLFKNPISTSLGEEGYLMNFNRKNLRAILLNAGNAENLGKLAKGYNLKPEQVMGWLHQFATKEDWDWGQKIGDMFAGVKKEADTMSRNLSGVEAGSVNIQPFATPHGEYAGWYYPIIYHPEFEGTSKKLMGGDALEQSNYNRASTPQGYTKARTGYSAPIALDMDMMPVRLRQMLHDIAMRPSVINASKIFYDKDVRSAMTKHYGREYTQLMVPYLRDVANAANFKSDAQKVGVQASEFIRQNMIATLIGFNPGTVLKHGPTAAVNSLHEVGTMNFLRAVKGLLQVNDQTGETNWNFAMRESEELQRRHRHYNETLGGAQQKVMGEGTLRENIIKMGSTPVALSDLLSATPTWMAQYEKSMREEGATHGDAVYMADRAVRRAHGSTAVTNRPGIVRGSGALGSWMASLYGFFNHIMNRQYELMWKAGDTLGMVKDGDYAKAMKMTPELTSGLFAYVILPALFEEMVTPLGSADNESWGKKAAKGLAFTLSASWVGIRDIASAMLNGRDPASGLMTTTFKTITDVGRDFTKEKPLAKENAGRIIQHGSTLMGALTGLTTAQMGKSLRYSQGVWTNTEKPRGPWDWMTGLRYGTNDKHSRSFEDYRKHMLGGH